LSGVDLFPPELFAPQASTHSELGGACRRRSLLSAACPSVGQGSVTPTSMRHATVTSKARPWVREW
jgi:hypothetical protein